MSDEKNKAKEAVSAPVKERVKKAAVEAPKMDPLQVQDALDKYDGFEELLQPLSDDLKWMSPTSGSKKKRFLQDKTMVEERANLRDELQAYLNFIEANGASDHKAIRSNAQEKLDKNEELINENLDMIISQSRDLERTYRELEMFFRNAQPEKAKNITLLGVNPDVVTDADSNLVYNAVEKLLMDEARSVDQRKAYSIFVMPDLWKSERPKDIIERYTKLAGDARVSFLTDFADTDSVEETINERESKRWAGYTGPELHHSKLVVFANHVVLRGEHKDLENDEDLRGSVAVAVAGKMYAEKISQPIMGEMNGSLNGSAGLAFRTVQDEVTDLSELCLNSTMNAYDKDMVYDSCTAFDGAEYPLKRYPVVRTFDYVNRVLRHYLGKVTGQQLDRKRANFVRDTVQDFLNDLTEQKIISSGKVTKFEWNSKVPDRIDLDIDIQPLWAVRTFVYSLKAKDNDADSELKEVKD